MKKGAWLEEHFPQGAKAFQGNQYKSGEVPDGNLTKMPVTKKE